ncbi:MAG: hypothetical protein AAFO82_14285 [Bacteroidota bacterium]
MLHNINIITHIMAGIIAILIGIIPYISEKGGKTHRRYGFIFLGLMGIVVLTALNGVIFFRDRPFLTVVTFQSFYFSYSGFRVTRTKEKGVSLIDFLVMILVAVIGISFLLKVKDANVLWNKAVVYYLLIYLFLIISFDLLRYFLPNLIRSKRFWLYEHIYKMTGAFTALFSAGMGTVFASWEPFNQIIPAVLGTFWLIFCLVYFPKRLKNKTTISKVAT